MEPVFADLGVPRYSKRNLPAYRHLPFWNPNPFHDRDGHSYGEKLSPPQSFNVETWWDCDDYLYSVDLFNNGFWWEAHVYFKQLCLAAGQNSQPGRFILGLVLIAAAMLNYYLAEPESAADLAQLGLDKLQSAEDDYLGIDVNALIQDMQQCLRSDLPEYPRIRLIWKTGLGS